jgi:tagatose-6-phosphate ketose/aldose isomerase
MFSSTITLSEWLHDVCERQPQAARLFRATEEEQRTRGYYHTLREIVQQPFSWIHTADQMARLASDLRPCLSELRNIVLTGSGSSEYAGHCVRLALQTRLGVNTVAIGGGALLTHSQHASPPGRPALLISLARSGDSPESVGALSLLLKTDPAIHHLVLTCNANGKLATDFRQNPRVRVVTLHDATNDRSLVMTSSFTNLALAAYSLGFLDEPQLYTSHCRQLSNIARQLLETQFDTLGQVGALGFTRAVFLGSGPRLGAILEAALKMLEMTAGQVSAVSETYLGLRHGPMSYVHGDTLVVCFLSSDATARPYECDLIRELNQKNLGMIKLIVGETVPSDLARGRDVVIECPGLAELGEYCAPVIEVVIAQLLGFFRCVREGLRPDSPSENGVINRVVKSFDLHLPAESSLGEGH